MVLQIDTIVGNKKPSKKLAGLLEDLANTVYLSYKDIEMKMEKIRAQAQVEDFSKQETIGLIKQYLKKISLTNNQIKWLTYLKPRIKEQKKRREEQGVNYSGANMSIAKPEPEPETASIPTDYKVVIPDQVLEEETKRLEQQEDTEPVNEALEELKPNYEIENLKIQLDTTQSNLDQALTDKKSLEEKYRQLEARTRISPSNNFLAVQGNTLRTKIVVNQVFREILTLKGSKVIYANVVIDTQQNKYVRLEPFR